MTFNELREKARTYPLFTLADVFKWFPAAKKQITLNQLNFWTKRGHLTRVKRGIYKLSDFEIRDPFLIANFIYSPSYISLESALNYYSLMPDIPFAVTSVTIRKTIDFSTKSYGKFIYHNLKADLFFGFESIKVDNYCYNIAFPEKAIFDFIYLKAKNIEIAGFPEEERFYFPKDFHWSKFKKYATLVPPKNKKFHQLKKILLKEFSKYG